MIIDARSVPAGTVLETPVCIIGAGAAGITLAREFIGAKFETVLLESGGLEFAPDTQDLYQGANVGRPFEDLTACRLRFFGGTTNHWAGVCAPYDAVDFEARFPYHGWPFDRAYLDPWYRRAQEVCQLGPFEYAPAQWGITQGELTPPFDGPAFVCKILQQSPPTRFGRVYEPELRRSARVKVYLQANALGFFIGDHQGEVGELAVATLSGVSFAVRARIFVIAVGGIENARLLLLSGKPGGNGLGNEHDLVGRYFMTNLVYHGGTIALSDPDVDLDAFTGPYAKPYGGFGFGKFHYLSQVGLSAEYMRERHLPNAKFFWGDPSILKRLGSHDRALLDDLSRAIGNVDRTAGTAARKISFAADAPSRSLELTWNSAQLPNPDSRVLLGTERDPFGFRRVAIDWQVTAGDKEKAIATHRLLGAEVGRTGLGRLRSTLNTDDTTWPEDFYGDEHHMGTTRMHLDRTLGVVDQNCRVHSLANLYVAGSSVFPTSGAVNPTLTIVALALRLADHVKERLA
jgi:choline dehydrogenase-like flavoprotein